MADDAISNVLSAVYGGMVGKVANTVIYSILVVLALGLVAFGFYIYKNWQAYNIQVRIYSKRKNGFKSWDDWGAFKKNKKTGEVEGFKLKKMKVMIQSPPYECMMASPKGNVLHLLQLSNEEFFVLNPEIDDPEKDKELRIKLKVIDSDIQLWGTTMIDKLYTIFEKKTFWEKYGAFLMFGIAAMMVIILIYLTLQKFEILKDVAASFKESVAMLKELRSSSITLPSTAP